MSNKNVWKDLQCFGHLDGQVKNIYFKACFGRSAICLPNILCMLLHLMQLNIVSYKSITVNNPKARSLDFLHCCTSTMCHQTVTIFCNQCWCWPGVWQNNWLYNWLYAFELNGWLLKVSTNTNKAICIYK